MGQLAGYWAAPNGYQPENEKWIGTLQPVMRFYYDTIWSGTGHIDPGTGAVVDNGLRVADATLDAIFPASAQPGAYPELAAERIAGSCLTQQELDAIRAILTAPAPPVGDLRRWALFYVLASPTYQYLC
jgi:hypothetical protein